MSGSSPRSRRRERCRRIVSVRPTANAGIMITPLRRATRRTRSPSCASVSTSECRRSPYVASVTSTDAGSNGLGARMSGSAARPRSPVKRTTRPSMLKSRTGRAEDMAGGHEREVELVCEPAWRVEVELREAPEGAGRVVSGVERSRRPVRRPSARSRVPGLLLEQVSAVGQHHAAQLRRARRGEDRASQPVPHEHGEISRVIKVRVCEHDGVDRPGGTAKSPRFRSRSTLNPWNSPQSTSTRELGESIRYFDPVTVSAAPRN
jgi:hypothetical protein